MRGLKPTSVVNPPLTIKSHPTWVRGLKHNQKVTTTGLTPSHPTWVRGLKLVVFSEPNIQPVSHPTWVRGLKLKNLMKYTNFVAAGFRRFWGFISSLTSVSNIQYYAGSCE